MKKLLASMITALLIAALLCPFAMTEEIAPEAVDAPVEVSDSVELPDEVGGEMLESQAELAAEGDASSGHYTFTQYPGPESGITVKTYVNGAEVTSADAGAQVTLVFILARPTISVTGVSAGTSSGPIELQGGADGAYTMTMPAANVDIYFSTAEGPGGGSGDDGSSGDAGSGETIPIDEAHFPDAAFRQIVTGFDTERDGCLSDAECQNVRELFFVQGNGFTSLQGIEYFPNLERLKCSDNALTFLDVSHNPALTVLDCQNNGLTALNVSHNPALTVLDCRNNGLTALDVSACPLLTEIVDDAYIVPIGYQTQDMTRYLYFDGKVTLTAGSKVLAPIPIDEAHFPDPAFRQAIVDCFTRANYTTDGLLGDCLRKSVAGIGEESRVPGLTIKIIEMNWASGKPIWKAGITSLQGVEYFPNLVDIRCFYNPISTLDVSMLKKLEDLECYHCGMTSLNISGCDSLLIVSAEKNALKSVTVPDNVYFAGFPTGFKKGTNPDKTFFCNKFIGPTQIHGNTVNYVIVSVDKGVKITGTNGSISSSGSADAPAVPASFTNTSEDVSVTVDAGSTAKNTKATVIAAQGSTTQIEVTGATGKKFKSSNKKVATVDKNGVVTIKGSGKVKITYKVGKKTRKVTLNVTDTTFPTSIALNMTGTVEAKVGESQTLTATLNEGAVSSVKWKSSKKKIAAVDANGVVTFKKAGKVKITATTTRGKIKASVTFKVTK